ncbi:stage II sporulation protein P [Virgibacillus byunsanensis]|uniref:Stage II sporulation protein P n=1 Tax=Virgibacillus byunsanensis TaxID=570945 RepID=A0ABW3LJP1_9BACI
MKLKDRLPNTKKRSLNPLYKKSFIYIVSVIVLFVGIGLLTTIQPAYRFTSHNISDWTSEIDSSTFLYLLGMENRAFQQAYPEDKTLPKLSSTLFQMVTSMKPNDTRSLLGREIPGFSTFDRIIVAGEGTDYINFSIESSPPIDEVLKDREAEIEEHFDEDEIDESNDRPNDTPTTGDRDVVYIYNTHNRESFLPHLPDESDPDLAQHPEVNVTMVSKRLSQQLETYGIGSQVDNTDIIGDLGDKGLSYGQAYDASREVVQEAFSNNDAIQYVFDIHRDSVPRNKTTKEINGEKYARLFFIVGGEYATYEKNLRFVTELNEQMEESYPGLSRGVKLKEGLLTNGVFNQDLSENSVVVEFGGVENNMDELYRTADAFAEVFSDFYWDAEKVNADSGEE